MSPFAERRRRLLERLQGVLVVFAAPVAIRNNDVEHEYRQDSDFFYLTGFDEPGSVLVLLDAARPAQDACSSSARAIPSARPGTARAPASTARTSTSAPTRRSRSPSSTTRCPKLPQRRRRGSTTASGATEPSTTRCSTRSRAARAPRPRRHDLADARSSTRRRSLHEMRLFKGDEEIARCAAPPQITARSAPSRRCAAPSRACTSTRSRRSLRETFRRARRRAPGVRSRSSAPAPNATILHYRANNRRLEDGRAAPHRCRLRVRLLRARRHPHVPGRAARSRRAAARDLRDRARGAAAAIEAVQAGRDARGGARRGGRA